MNTQTIDNGILVESKAKNIALWTVQVLAAGMFLMAGSSKLSGAPQMVGLFNAIGIGQWFRYVTGGIEVVSALLLLTPKFSGIGALLLVPTMAGALLTHAFIIGGNPTPAIALFVASVIVAYGRWNRTRSLLNR
jgi:uncharacterized membrane protein YphA (DoxX/SURF4 family)